MIPDLKTVRRAVRPYMLATLLVMIGPLALVSGTLEAFLPGRGVAFADGFTAYLTGLPDAFWIFAAAAYGIYTWKVTDEKKAGVRDAGMDCDEDLDTPSEMMGFGTRN